MNKPSFRQRPIDYSKPLQLIKDINEVKKTADQAEKEEITIMESELKKILELYDRKKSIIIPKTEKIYKPLNEKINIKEQVLEKNTRNGFTVVEWGGRKIK